MHATPTTTASFQDKGEAEKIEIKQSLARRIYIRQSDYEAHGLTDHCPRCEHTKRYGPGRTTKPHSQECRDRIVEELAKTPEGQARIKSATERAEKSVAEHIEQQVPSAEGEKSLDVRGRDPVDVPLRFEELDAPRVAPVSGPDTIDHSQKAENVDEPVRDISDRRESANPGGDAPLELDDDQNFDAMRSERIANDPGMDIDLVDGDADMRELLESIARDVRQQVNEIDMDVMQIIGSMGGGSSRYRRERKKAFKAVLSEIYSPPRVTAMAKMCPSYGVLPGFALDLTTHDADGRIWDFDDPDMRERAWNKIKTERPLLIVGSPMCTAFSAWQYINNRKREGVIVNTEFQRALVHLEFCMDIYDYQRRTWKVLPS